MQWRGLRAPQAPAVTGAFLSGEASLDQIQPVLKHHSISQRRQQLDGQYEPPKKIVQKLRAIEDAIRIDLDVLKELLG
ncbi:MAG TPA: hypothetical protein V6C57_11995 [Coleofasciculaceae cyanobacterium]